MLLEILQTGCLLVSSSKIENLADIFRSILCQPHRVTTRSISRMSEMSLRSLERFYSEFTLDWLLFRLQLFATHCFNKYGVYLIVGDETVEKKAGKSTHGISYFYSSLFKKPIRAVSYLGFSLVSVLEEKSYFMLVNQLVKSSVSAKNTSKPATKRSKKKSKKGVTKKSAGRPKGSKNKPYQEPENLSYQSMKKGLVQLLRYFRVYLPDLQVPYLVLDGFYGHQSYFKLTESQDIHLITKLKCNSHLIFRYEGQQKGGRGAKKRLGERVNYDQIPSKYLVQNSGKQQVVNKKIKIYEFVGYANAVKGQLLKFVIIQSPKLKNNKMGQVILVSSDLNLTAEKIIHYYHLRFQIEFDFRNAKQFFGLSTFQNYKQKQVDMAVNIAFSMTLIAQILLKKYKKILQVENLSINDLKACYRVDYYYKSFLNMPQKDTQQFLFDQKIIQIIRNEAINI